MLSTFISIVASYKFHVTGFSCFSHVTCLARPAGGQLVTWNCLLDSTTGFSPG